MLFPNWGAGLALIAGISLAAGAMPPSAASADDDRTVTLTPADPQPDESALKPGLAVWYKGADVKKLQDAEGWLEDDPSAGEPIDATFHHIWDLAREMRAEGGREGDGARGRPGERERIGVGPSPHPPIPPSPPLPPPPRLTEAWFC